MRIVIDIDENLYSYISKEDAVYFPDDGGELFEAVKNGTPLDKIRAEIVHLHDWAFSREEVLRIIDKYKAESEDKE